MVSTFLFKQCQAVLRTNSFCTNAPMLSIVGCIGVVIDFLLFGVCVFLALLGWTCRDDVV